MKYKDIIFDLGNVLLVYSPAELSEPYVDNLEDRQLLEKAVFSRDIWDKLDIGAITDEECKAVFRQRLPKRLHNAAIEAYDNWIDNMYEVEGIRELIQKLKRAGCRVFVLSNISKGFSDYENKPSILKEFDGAVFSADLEIAKPDSRIFNYIMDKYSIDAKSAVFIDDKPANVEGAKAVGLEGYVFSFDVDRLEAFLFD